MWIQCQAGELTICPSPVTATTPHALIAELGLPDYNAVTVLNSAIVVPRPRLSVSLTGVDSRTVLSAPPIKIFRQLYRAIFHHQEKTMVVIGLSLYLATGPVINGKRTTGALCALEDACTDHIGETGLGKAWDAKYDIAIQIVYDRRGLPQD